MAKNKNRDDSVNKSQAIRDVLSQNPKMSSKEIVSTLAGQGLKVLPSLVYFVKGQMRRKRRKQIGNRMTEAGVSNPVDLILKVRSLAEQAGGMRKLKQLVDALAE